MIIFSLSTKRKRKNREREGREGVFSFSLHKACQTLQQDGLAIFDSLLDLYRENNDNRLSSLSIEKRKILSMRFLFRNKENVCSRYKENRERLGLFPFSLHEERRDNLFFSRERRKK